MSITDVQNSWMVFVNSGCVIFLRGLLMLPKLHSTFQNCWAFFCLQLIPLSLKKRWQQCLQQTCIWSYNLQVVVNPKYAHPLSRMAWDSHQIRFWYHCFFLMNLAFCSTKEESIFAVDRYGSLPNKLPEYRLSLSPAEPFLGGQNKTTFVRNISPSSGLCAPDVVFFLQKK